ncbi:MAG: NAD(P)H-dependent oxidoreductase [Proteobacteria bacterium]|nr:NAD(P)H-dependent oxidoreductase [Pseudomonadota bacterium]
MIVLRVLVIYAHPLADSLNGALFACVKESLAAAGHEVDALDLYAENFDPVLSADERRAYFDVEANRARTEPYVARLEAAEGLVFVFPPWCLGPPAILKGFFDRIMVPGVSFRLEEDGSLSPNLRHIKKAAAVVTYGRERPLLWWFGDPPRRMMTRYLKWFLAPGTRPVFLGHYGLHKPDDAYQRRFIEKVRRTMRRF